MAAKSIWQGALMRNVSGKKAAEGLWEKVDHHSFLCVSSGSVPV